jgi:hypothetical protein
MPKFMSVSTALARLVEDDAAPVGSRVRALRQLDHPSLALLRRLLVDTSKRTILIPSRLRAVATLAYARELQLRKHRPRKRKSADSSVNPLGI